MVRISCLCSCPPNLSLEDSAFKPSRMKHGAYLLFFLIFYYIFFFFSSFFLIISWLCFLWRILLDKSQILCNAELSFWKPSWSHLQGFLFHTLNQCLTRWRARPFLRLLSLVFSQDIVNVRVCVCVCVFNLLGIHNVENCISPQNLKNGLLGMELYNIINLEKIISNKMLKDEDHI